MLANVTVRLWFSIFLKTNYIVMIILPYYDLYMPTFIKVFWDISKNTLTLELHPTSKIFVNFCSNRVIVGSESHPENFTPFGAKIQFLSYRLGHFCESQQ